MLYHLKLFLLSRETLEHGCREKEKAHSRTGHLAEQITGKQSFHFLHLFVHVYIFMSVTSGNTFSSTWEKRRPKYDIMGRRIGFSISHLQAYYPAASWPLDGEGAGLQPSLTPLGDRVLFENSDIGVKYQQGWQEDNTGSVSPCIDRFIPHLINSL